MTGINKNKEILKIENDFLLLLQDKELFKELVNSNKIMMNYIHGYISLLIEY